MLKLGYGRTLVMFGVVSLLALSVFTPIAFASSAPSGTWTVTYYTGSVSGSTCTGSLWPTSAKDGTAGFATNNFNLLGPQYIPTVDYNTNICIVVSVIGGTPNTTFWFQVDNSAPVGTFTTDGSGNGQGAIVFLNDNPGDLGSGQCYTIPLFVSNKLNPQGKVALSGSQSGQADHLFLASSTGACGATTTSTTTTSTQGVPEFPVASLGLLAVVGLALPLMLVLRKVSIRAKV